MALNPVLSGEIVKRLLLIALPLLFLSACPKTSAPVRQAPAREASQGAAPPPESEPAPGAAEAPDHPESQAEMQGSAPEIYSSTDPAEVIRAFGRFLNERDRERYSACIHEQSPRRESLLFSFDDFASGDRRFQIDAVSIENTEPGHALASYSLSVIHSGSGERETEDGEFELLQLDDGNWVIWTIN